MGFEKMELLPTVGKFFCVEVLLLYGADIPPSTVLLEGYTSIEVARAMQVCITISRHTISLLSGYCL